MRYQKKHDFPFGILDVADILRLNIRRRLPDQVYADCPFCSDRRGKMNLNLEKDTWRCNYCGRGGGMLGLYAVLNGVDKSQAYHDISAHKSSDMPIQATLWQVLSELRMAGV